MNHISDSHYIRKSGDGRHPLRCPRSSPRQRPPWRTRPSGQHRVSTSSRIQDAYGNNAFGYTIKDGLGATNSRSEGPTGGLRRRRTRIQGHRQDQRARTAASAPAAALIASPYAGPVAPVVNHVAPAVAVGHVASYAAPLAVAAPVAYGGVIGHGAALGLGAPLGLGYGAGLGLGYSRSWSCSWWPLDWDMAWVLARDSTINSFKFNYSKQLHMTTIIKLSAQIEIPNMPLPTAASLSSSVDLTFKTHNKSPFCKMGTLLQPFYFIM
ncbi:adult-specific rigid cuticular protein 15.7 [Caerostris extrusa]|uniref:Adult-specific rigid cuticular protein 15.7 n=1 Tax=Caerostris extrusa TaxID=172846 RepID=A0AAV4NJJ3_CAEEX|nr:adult-specific rigid cuticular protein 15.7 [Caerostris extrusa]